MTTFMMVIIYLVVGFGAFWLVSKLNERYMTELFVRYEETDFRGVMRYMERKRMWTPNQLNRILAILCVLLGVVIWAVWPVTAIVSMIWNYVDYRMTLKEGKEVVGS